MTLNRAIITAAVTLSLTALSSCSTIAGLITAGTTPPGNGGTSTFSYSSSNMSPQNQGYSYSTGGFGPSEPFYAVLNRYSNRADAKFVAVIVIWQERLRPFLSNPGALANLSQGIYDSPLQRMPGEINLAVSEIGGAGRLDLADQSVRASALNLVNATATMTQQIKSGNPNPSAAESQVGMLLAEFLSYHPAP